MKAIRRRDAFLVAMLVACRLRPAAAATPLRIRDLYGRGSAFSDKAMALADQPVEVTGFMAPPLKAEATFFVLTKLPMAICPFCDSEMDWPNDIVLVRLNGEQPWVDFNVPIAVSGTLSLGTEIDQETGFVSRVRIVDAIYRRL